MSRTLLLLAGFQVILSGRFWVIAEGMAAICLSASFVLSPEQAAVKYPLRTSLDRTEPILKKIDMYGKLPYSI